MTVGYSFFKILVYKIKQVTVFLRHMALLLLLLLTVKIIPKVLFLKVFSSIQFYILKYSCF